MKDRDSQHIALYLRTLPYAFIAAGLMFGAGLMTGGSLGEVLLLTLAAFLVALVVPPFLAERASAAGSFIYHASGSSTPALREYSLADSLVARGRAAEAAEAYRLLAEDHPDDPEPAIRRARLLRDTLGQNDLAAEWFRRALAVRGIKPAVEVALLRELCELYTHKLKAPTRALPHLARLIDKYPATPAGVWARAEQAEIKRDMLMEHTGE